jgi:hypothetical protein
MCAELMTDTKTDAAVLHEAAKLNREDPLRSGSLLEFPDYGQLVMTGDLHGHQRNFHKLRKFADLEHSPARHVMLHELIHAEPDEPLAPDMSHITLIEAARWKTEFPDQVHFLQSNHEMSQLTRKDICKGGRIVTHDFERGLAATYGSGAEEVLEGICDYIASLALAGRTANRIFLSHSLPNTRVLSTFDASVVRRDLEPNDLLDGGDAYSMVWGRNQTPESLETLAAAFDVDRFICGHQPQEDGYDVVHDKLIILASDHNHGVFLPFDLKRKYETADLVRLIRRFAAIE